ncbi:MAG: 50S ribosomal protein L4 [Candidatus Gottesmanbacteria bacterium]|nr:50S ribosomal protein L4 [Candidatus Gottesmanbacteria bacterium]
MPKVKKAIKKIVKKPVVKTKPVSRATVKTRFSPTSPRSPKIPQHPPLRRSSSEASQSPQSSSIAVPVHGIDGKSVGTIAIPAELFGAKINNALVAQAVRVYLANQREGGAATKTRGQVEGSTRKIYRQKGTGRARHGGIRAPIFVGGGITFGPHPRDYHLDLPQKMKRAALASALTSAKLEGKLMVIDGLGGLSKTKAMAAALQANGVKGSTLLIVGSDAKLTTRVSRNIADIDILSAQNLHAYVVLSHQTLVFMKEAIAVLKSRYRPEKSV